jgi:hypothetical protein
MTLVAALSFAEPARADATIEQAKQWFAEGDKAEEKGDCGTAIQKFRQALDVKETPQLHLRIGRCQEKLGALFDAYESYRAGRRLAGANDKIAGVADEQIAAIKPKVPRLTLVVKSPPPGLEVRVNGAAVSSFVEDRYLNPGEVVVTARADGYSPFSAKMNLEANDKRSLEVALTPLPKREEPSRPPTPTEPESTGPSPASYVLLGVGIAGIGTGIGLLVHGFGLQSKLEDPSQFGCKLVSGKYQCKEVSGKPVVIGGQTATQVQSASNTFKGAGGAVLGVGGAAATVGVILLFATRHTKPASGPSVTLAPAGGPGLAGIGVQGTF